MGAPALRAATRGSALALVQTAAVAERLAAHGLAVEPTVVETTGDRRVDLPLRELGGSGVFVKEIQNAVLEGRADIAVHSAKDVPSAQADGLVIGAVPGRADPRDALVGCTLDDLPPGARVATGSVRRRAQLAWLRPDITVYDLRGNIHTRLSKASQFHAIVVAAAALERLGLADMASQVLEPWLVVPQVGQGALAVECRADDIATRALLDEIDDLPSRVTVEAERSFLAEVGGSCDLPVGAHATLHGAQVHLEGMIATGDGRVVLRHQGEGEDPLELGASVARYLLDSCGGSHLLEVGRG